MAREPSTNPRYEYQRAWNEANHATLKARQLERYAIFRKFVDDYKLERGCIDCGYKANPAALDLDHRDPSDKRTNVATMVTYDRALLLAELAKCDVRCANCHRIKTKESGDSRRRSKG
jgi:hypothetical protein